MKQGDVISNRYEIGPRIGVGMGMVWRAKDLQQEGREVAFKIVRQGADNAEIARFMREIEVLASIQDPRIVTYLDHGEINGDPWLITEWLEGQSLSQYLRTQMPSLGQSLRLGIIVAETLGRAHDRGLVHRDIKPGNIQLVDDDFEQLKLLDFGIVRLLDTGPVLTMTGTPIGTPAYMSPEQARGEKVDARSDVFSLACVLFECITGQKVFSGENAIAIVAKVLLDDAPRMSDIVCDVPAALDDLIARCLSKQADERPATARELATALRIINRQERSEEARLSVAPVPRRITGEEQRPVTIVLMKTERWIVPAELDDLARRYEARIESFAKGAVAALLCSNTSITDQALQAVQLAMDLRTHFGNAPMGIVTGKAVVGQRMPVGEAIDRAVRLLQGALRVRSNDMHVDRTTANLLERRYEIRTIGDHMMIHGPRQHDHYWLLGRPTPFVGRKRELRTVENAVESSIDDEQASVLLFTGESGVGKSRMLAELFEQLVNSDPPLRVLRASVHRGDAHSSFGLIARLVQMAAGISANSLYELCKHRLELLLRENTPYEEAQRIAEFLTELIRPPGESAGSLQLQIARRDPQLMGDQIRRAFEDLIIAESRVRPVVLLVDDLQWADRASLSLLDRLLHNLSNTSLVLVGFARPELLRAVPDIFSQHDLTASSLRGLSPKASHTFIRSILENVSDSAVERIVNQASGNALYLEELVRAEAHHFAGATEQSTVTSMMQIRLSSLEANERRVLRAAAVLGDTFWKSVLIELTGAMVDGLSIDELLTQLQARELIQQAPHSRFVHEQQWLFGNNSIRDAAYAMLTDQDRQLGHRIAGQWLLKHGANSPITMMHHFIEGQVPEEAAKWCYRAGEAALAGDDLKAAVGCADRGIEAGAEGLALANLQLLKAQAQMFAGEPDNANQLACQAIVNFPEGSSGWYEALQLSLLALERIARLPALIEIQEMIDARPEDNHLGKYLLMAKLCHAYYNFGEEHRNPLLLAKIADAPDDVRNRPDLAALTHRIGASRAIRQGNTSEMLHYLEAALRCYEELGNRRRVCSENVNISFALAELGLYEEAEARLHTSLVDAKRMSLAHLVQAAECNLGHILTRRGQLAEGHEILARIVDADQAQSTPRMTGTARLDLARNLRLQGKLLEAELMARAGLDLIRQSSKSGIPWASTILAEVLLARGDVAEALELSRKSYHAIPARRASELEDGLVRVVFAKALAANGRQHEAASVIEVSRDLLLKRSRRITRAEWQHAFLHQVAEHAETMHLAHAWIKHD